MILTKKLCLTRLPLSARVCFCRVLLFSVVRVNNLLAWLSGLPDLFVHTPPAISHTDILSVWVRGRVGRWKRKLRRGEHERVTHCTQGSVYGACFIDRWGSWYNSSIGTSVYYGMWHCMSSEGNCSKMCLSLPFFINFIFYFKIHSHLSAVAKTIWCLKRSDELANTLYDKSNKQKMRREDHALCVLWSSPNPWAWRRTPT